MRTGLRRDLVAAMKARDTVAVAALRSALAAIDNAEAVGAPVVPVAGGEHVAGAVAGLGAAEAERRELTGAELSAIVAAEVAERLAAAVEYEALGQGDVAARLRSEVGVLRRHLPADR